MKDYGSIPHKKQYLFSYLRIACSPYMALSGLLYKHPGLAIGITYDLAFTVPLVYFLMIRKKNIPKTTVIPFFVLGLLVAKFALPAGRQYHVSLLFSYVLSIVELLALIFMGTKIYKITKAYRRGDNRSRDQLHAFQQIAAAFGKGRIASAIGMEMAMMYYAFFAWKPKRSKGAFTYHKENGLVALLAVLLLLILAETFILHVLRAHWSVAVAWVLTMHGQRLYFHTVMGAS